VSSERVVVPFSSTATFSPLAYLPQALGVLVARSVGANLLIQVLAGRLFNLAAYISMLAIIARTLPVGNAIFFGLSLVPSALYLAASLSADPINFTIPAALFAICLRYRDSPHNVMTSNGWMQVAALTAAVGLLKIVCVVFAGAPLLIPWQRFGSKRNKSLFLIGAIGTSLLLCAAWNVTHPFDPERTWHASITPGGLTFLIEEPLHTAGILLQTIPKLCLLYWSAAYEQIGGIVGFDQIAPVWAALPALSMIVLLAISEGRRRDFAAAAILTFLASAFAGLLLLAFLLTFTPPNATMILGVQGRYFFMFFMLLGWAATRLGLAGPRLTKLCPALLAATLIMNACFLIYAVRFFDNLWIF
jgi:uncharacterized membrane protein